MDQLKSGFIYQCPMCPDLRRSDVGFKEHILTTHKKEFPKFGDFLKKFGRKKKKIYLNNPVFHCLLCYELMVQRASVVERHLRKIHGLKYFEYKELVTVAGKKKDRIIKILEQ